MDWLVGVDVGGTFTDFYAANLADGDTRFFKRPSTPHNPGEAIVTGLQEMCAALKLDPSQIRRVSHGTTVATNALIQRRGGQVAMVTTAGFRDLLEIGRQTRPHMFSLQQDHPAPLVPRQRRFEVTERMNSVGEAVVPLDEASIADVVDAVRESGAESIAVCFLFAFMNADHEQRVGAQLNAALPGVQISLSSAVRPEFREYERFSTTVLNAYLQPVMTSYLDYLERKLTKVAPHAPVRIYQSSGGLMSVDTAREFPIRTALSGPAAGAVGAVHTARALNRPNVITLDMGGTSADVALIREFDSGISMDRDVAGFPVRLPMVDISTVGAGGGSIAWFDRDGLLKVGPRSAGADPGPACYGKGGDEPAVTDANLALGRLSAGGLIGGTMALDVAAARSAIGTIATKLDSSVETTAKGILGIVVANMVRAVRTISVERGLDPRAFSLMPFGGAGPLHAVEVARVLNIREVLVPVAPGILCAQGLLASDLKEDFVQSGRFPIDASTEHRLAKMLDALEREAIDWFGDEDIADADRFLTVTLDARYVGQNFELPTTFTGETAGALPRPGSADDISNAFHAVHERFYGFASHDEPVEIINVRVTATGKLGGLATTRSAASDALAPAPIGSRPVWFERDDAIDCPVYDRATFAAGMTFVGPAIIEQLDTTTVVFPGDVVTVDPSMNLVIKIDLPEGAAS